VTKRKYLKLVSRARYAINPSKHEAFSMFTADTLAMGAPAIVSKKDSREPKSRGKATSKRLGYSRKSIDKKHGTKL
jgi:hypothetical protein